MAAADQGLTGMFGYAIWDDSGVTPREFEGEVCRTRRGLQSLERRYGGLGNSSLATLVARPRRLFGYVTVVTAGTAVTAPVVTKSAIARTAITEAGERHESRWSRRDRGRHASDTSAPAVTVITGASCRAMGFRLRPAGCAPTTPPHGRVGGQKTATRCEGST